MLHYTYIACVVSLFIVSCYVRSIPSDRSTADATNSFCCGVKRKTVYKYVPFVCTMLFSVALVFRFRHLVVPYIWLIYFERWLIVNQWFSTGVP
jgi:hypothetical protein